MKCLDAATDLTTITLEAADDGIALVTLNRPDRLNAITSTMIDELDRVVTAVDLDPELRAVVLTGAGRGFCAGLDLMEQGTAPGAEDVRPVVSGFMWQDHLATLHERIHRSRKPWIAAVNGTAAGGGYELALACDEILLIDDDDDLRDALAEQLVMTEEFDVFEGDSGASGMTRAKEQLYDLIVLDVGLPDTDGRELCRLMRKSGVKCPIVMLTGHDTDADTILGLDAGANDYIAKPFKFPVLLARIRAQLRQHEQSEDAVFTLGPYTFKPSMKMLVTEEDRKIRLTEKETNILKYLYRANDGTVARDVLLHEVWGYNAGVTTHTLETHIYRLRQKIEPDPSNARLLVTESGGYRLMA